MSRKHKLKPCPFCGEAAELRLCDWVEPGQFKQWHLGCQDELCVAHEIVCTDEDDIKEDVARWNAREGEA